MTGFIFGAMFGVLVIAWLLQRVGAIKVITEYRASGVIEYAVGQKMRWEVIWKTVAPWLTFAAAVGLGWVVRGGC